MPRFGGAFLVDWNRDVEEARRSRGLWSLRPPAARELRDSRRKQNKKDKKDRGEICRSQARRSAPVLVMMASEAGLATSVFNAVRPRFIGRRPRFGRKGRALPTTDSGLTDIIGPGQVGLDLASQPIEDFATLTRGQLVRATRSARRAPWRGCAPHRCVRGSVHARTGQCHQGS